MSKEFRDSHGKKRAQWTVIGCFDLLHDIPAEDIPAFIVWLQEGPPKKEWRITRTFGFKPVFVSDRVDENGVAIVHCFSFLTDDDVEEVEE
jgi:hypothetical protein